MTDSYRRIARMDEEFPGLLAALKPALKGLVPDDSNFTEDSYDELFIILASALYYVRDSKLRMASANDSGGNPKLVSMLMNEGIKDKDAILTEKILDRIAPYVPVRVFLNSLKTMYANKSTPFVEYHGAIERITADLFRISAGFKAAEHCPVSLVQWASGPLRASIYEELHTL
jgi:hypothetical protein